MKARKPRVTKQALEERAERAEHQNTILSYALNALAHGEEPDARVSFRSVGSNGMPDGWTQKIALYRALAPHGGFVVWMSILPGQSPSVSAHYFDDVMPAPDARHLHNGVELSALDRLNSVRRSVIENDIRRSERFRDIARGLQSGPLEPAEDDDVTYGCTCTWIGGDPDEHDGKHTCPACWAKDHARVEVYIDDAPDEAPVAPKEVAS